MKSLGLTTTDAMLSSARCNFSRSFVSGSSFDFNRGNSTQHGNKPKDETLGWGEILPVSPNNGEAARIGPFINDNDFDVLTFTHIFV